MRFAWDPSKSAANHRERGFDFAFAALIFEGLTLVQEDRRQGYGERRLVAIGLADGIALTVVFTDRVDAHHHLERRIISARRSNRHERQAYQEALRER